MHRIHCLLLFSSSFFVQQFRHRGLDAALVLHIKFFLFRHQPFKVSYQFSLNESNPSDNSLLLLEMFMKALYAFFQLLQNTIKVQTGHALR